MTLSERTGNLTTAVGERRGLAVLLVVFLLFALLQLLWLQVDHRPVVEERHYFAAARMAHGLQGSTVGQEYPVYGNVSPYPPLVVYWTAPILALVGVTADNAVLTLLPFALILLWAVWRAGLLLYSNGAALTGALLVLTFHHFTVVEEEYPPFSFLKEYLLDLPLSAMTALTLYLLLLHLSREGRPRPLILGVVMAMGALTKVTFPVYIVLIAVSLFAGGYRDLSRWRSLLPSALVAGAIALPWYILHFRDLAATFLDHEISSQWARECGKPDIWSAAGFLYYPKLIPSMISLPFTAFLAAAFILMVLTRSRGWRLIGSGMLLSYVALSMIYGKDARLIAPFMTFAALAGAAFVDLFHRPGSRAAVLIVLWAGAGLRVASMNGFSIVHTEEVSIPPPQVAPAGDDWSVRSIMETIEKERDRSLLLRMAVIPFLGHFRHSSFMQYALRNDLPLADDSGWNVRCDKWREELEASEFIVTKEGYGGPGRFVPRREEAHRWIRSHLGESVFLLGEYPLPDGSNARLYRHDRPPPDWTVLPPADTLPLAARFGDIIELSSYNIALREGRLQVKCEWRALKAPVRAYKFFVQVRRGYRNIAAESFVPGGGFLPITRWNSGFRLSETYALTLPPLSSGEEYEVWAGWHRKRRRLPVGEATAETSLKALRLGSLKP